MAQPVRQHPGRTSALTRLNVPANRQADPAVVRQLYEEQRHTVQQIAQVLSVSRAQVRAALKAEGVQWRSTRKPCPLTVEQLRTLVANGAASPAMLARRYNVARNTAARWLADAGLLSQDPAIDENSLREMYVEQQMSTREVAALLGVNPSRILRALAAAAIAARPREMKRPRTAPMTAATTETSSRTGPLRRPASRTTSRRRRTGESSHAPPDLMTELLTDPDIVALLRTWDLTPSRSPQSQDIDPAQTPSPESVRAQLVVELYCRIGLSIRQVALLCSISDATVHRRLTAAGIRTRPATQPSPWTQRRLSLQR
jgi:DNA invertase Pin-like site-specific DNA recombinase